MTAEQTAATCPESDLVQQVAELWTAIRRFLRASEAGARKNGLTPQLHRVLVMTKGAPDGTESATVTDLTNRLSLAQSSVTEIVERGVAAGLLERRSSEGDGRSHLVRLTPEGERCLALTMAGLQLERERLVAAIAAMRHVSSATSA
jgi:DNA-binding MarR family transcriptional regulator